MGGGELGVGWGGGPAIRTGATAIGTGRRMRLLLPLLLLASTSTVYGVERLQEFSRMLGVIHKNYLQDALNQSRQVLIRIVCVFAGAMLQLITKFSKK